MFLIILRGFPYNHHIFWRIFSAAMFFFTLSLLPGFSPWWDVRERSTCCDVMIGAWGFSPTKQRPTWDGKLQHYYHLVDNVTTMSLLVNFHLTKLPDFVEQKTLSSTIKPRFKHHRRIVVSFPCSKFSLRISRIQIIRHPFNKSPWWCAVQLGTPWSRHWDGTEIANSSKACQLLQLELYALKIFTSWSRNVLSSNVLLLTRTLIGSTGFVGSTCFPCMWWATFSNMLRACRITGIHSRSPGLPGSWRSDMTWLLEVRESQKSDWVLKGQITSGAQSSRHNKCKVRDISTSCPEHF